MPFTQEQLPPIFEYIIKKIEENKGKITTDEFKDMLYSLRIEKDDIKDIQNWLHKRGYIIIKRECHRETTISLVKSPLEPPL